MRNKLFIVLVIAVFVPFIFSNWGLTESSEARYAEISKEMFIGRDFIHPDLLGIKHYHKPPVTYYITAAGFAVFGINEYGARFFLQLALIAQVMLVFLIAVRITKDERRALTAALLYFSYPVVQIAAKNLTTDAYLTAFIFAGIYCFLRYRADDRPKLFLYLLYLFASLAFLTKGPVGWLPIIFFAAAYFVTTKTRPRFGVHEGLALILCLAVSASWFTYLLLENRIFFDYFFRYQIVDRVSGNVFHREQPFWYYFMVMPPLALPAFVYFIGYLVKGVVSRAAISRIARLTIIPFAALLLVFSLSSSKLIFYVMPLYLFVAIASAKFLFELPPRWLKAANVYSLLMAIIFLSVPWIVGYLDLGLTVPAAVLPIAMSSLAVIVVLFLKIRGESSMKPAILNAVTIGLLMLVLPLLMKANETYINSPRPVADFIRAQDPHGTRPVAVYNRLVPSLGFYLPNRVYTIDEGSELRETFFGKYNTNKRFGYFRLGTADTTQLKTYPGSMPNILVAGFDEDLPANRRYLAGGRHRSVIDSAWVIYY